MPSYARSSENASRIVGLVFILLGVLTLYTCTRGMLEEEARKYQEREANVGFWEDGVYVKPPKSDVKPFQRRPTSIITQPNSSLRIQTNCEEDLLITTLRPREQIHIRHVILNRIIDNRCSYSAVGYAPATIAGTKGEVVRPKFRNDLPFPNLPVECMVFYLKPPNTTVNYLHLRQYKKRFAYIPSDGGIITLTNTLTTPQEVRVVFNTRIELLKGGSESGQVGWDGSTATFIATTFMKEQITP